MKNTFIYKRGWCGPISLLLLVVMTTSPMLALAEVASTTPEVPLEETTVPEEEPTDTSANEVVEEPLMSTSTEESEEDTTIIDTGAAETTTDLNNEVNTTEVDTAMGSTSSSTVIEVEQAAEVNNTSTSTAETGDNLATSSEEVIINTGDAVSTSNFINLVNTTIVNSQGFLVLLNLLFGSGTFDMSDIDFESFLDQMSGTPGEDEMVNCSLEGCSDPNIKYSVTSSSTATVNNSYVVRSNTGGNMASGTEAYINTGNSYSFLNGLNVVNTNFIDSNYLLLSVNNIGNFSGDLVFPGFSFFEKFLSSSLFSAIETNVTNHAVVENNIDIETNTGDNTASTTSEAVVSTGNSCAYANVSNTVNQTYIGGGAVNILVRVSGNWSGEIFGLPQGLSWEQTGEGIRIYNEPIVGAATSTSQAIASTTINNDAYVNNDISVVALTGDNKVEGGEGLIETGDACAVANIQNVVNTSVIGSNWMSAFFNILGNFEGDIAFGRPDLWIGGVANVESEYVEPGSSVEYTYTIVNNGDSYASDIVLKQEENSLLSKVETNDLPLMASTTSEWEVGSLAPGESVEMTFTADVSEALPYGTTPLELAASVTGYEPDGNDEDNSETISLLGYRRMPSSGGGNNNGSNDDPDLIVQKWVGTSTELTIDEPLEDGATSTPVRYTILVTNTGGQAYDAILHDTVTAADGTVISEQRWELGTIQAGEAIEVSYVVEFSRELADGLYSNTAWLEAYDKDKEGERDVDGSLSIGKSSVNVSLNRTPLEVQNVEVNATGSFADTNTAEVRWTTNRSSDSRVVYGPAGTFDANASSSDSFGYQELRTNGELTLDHVVLLEDLQPDTTYYFRAVSYDDDEFAISSEGIFQTAKVESTAVVIVEEPVTIVEEIPEAIVAGVSTSTLKSSLLPIAYAADDQTATGACTVREDKVLAIFALFIIYATWVWGRQRYLSIELSGPFLTRNLIFGLLFSFLLSLSLLGIPACMGWQVPVTVLGVWVAIEMFRYYKENALL